MSVHSADGHTQIVGGLQCIVAVVVVCRVFKGQAALYVVLINIHVRAHILSVGDLLNGKWQKSNKWTVRTVSFTSKSFKPNESDRMSRYFLYKTYHQLLEHAERNQWLKKYLSCQAILFWDEMLWKNKSEKIFQCSKKIAACARVKLFLHIV